MGVVSVRTVDPDAPGDEWSADLFWRPLAKDIV
jgi:hypothetical protein